MDNALYVMLSHCSITLATIDNELMRINQESKKFVIREWLEAKRYADVITDLAFLIDESHDESAGIPMLESERFDLLEMLALSLKTEGKSMMLIKALMELLGRCFPSPSSLTKTDKHSTYISGLCPIGCYHYCSRLSRAL